MTRGVTVFEKQSLRRLRQKLDRMPEKVKAEIKTAQQRNGEDLTSKMKAYAPVDPGSGELRNSIEWFFPESKPSFAGFSRSTRLSIKGEQGLSIIVKAGPDVSDDQAFYARWVEFGHMSAFTNALIPPNPFFYPVYRMRRRAVRGRISRAMNKGLKETAANV